VGDVVVVVIAGGIQVVVASSLSTSCGGRVVVVVTQRCGVTQKTGVSSLCMIAVSAVRDIPGSLTRFGRGNDVSRYVTKHVTKHGTGCS